MAATKSYRKTLNVADKIQEQIFAKFRSRIDDFKEETVDRLRTPIAAGGVGAVDYYRREDHTPHATKWRAYSEKTPKGYVIKIRNDATNKRNLSYAKYIYSSEHSIGHPYGFRSASPHVYPRTGSSTYNQVTQRRWNDFVDERLIKLSRMLKKSDRRGKRKKK